MTVPDTAQPGRAPLARAAIGLRARIPQIVDDLQEQLLEVVFRDTSVSDSRVYEAGREERESLEANLHAICSRLEHGIAGVGAPPAALQLAHRFVDQRIDDLTISRIYHVGQSLIWERWLLPALIEECADAARDLGASTQLAHHELADYLDRVCDELLEQVRTERVRLGGPARAIDLVNGVLAGHDPGKFMLGHPIGGQHVAFICWTQADGTPTHHQLDAVATAIPAILNGTSRLLVTATSHEIVGWVSVPPDDHPVDLTTLSLSCAAIGPRVHVAFGTAQAGLTGFRASHHEARQVQEYVSATARVSPTLTSYAEVAYESLLMSDRARARRYSAGQLGPLGANTDDMRELRRTTLAFLRCGQSYIRTAELLTMHRNTINYRIRKVEQMLGYRLDTAALELQAALVIADCLDARTSDD